MNFKKILFYFALLMLFSCSEQKSNQVVQVQNSVQPVIQVITPGSLNSPITSPTAKPSAQSQSNPASPNLNQPTVSPNINPSTPIPTLSPEPVNGNTQNSVFSADWSIIKPLPSVKDMSFVDFNTGWIVGEGGAIKHTQNAGLSWVSQNKGSADLHSVYFINKNIGWVSGNNGVIFKTLDGGSKWTILDSTTSESVDKIRFVNENEGFFLTYSSIYKTQDGGSTWEKVKDNRNGQSAELYFSTGNNIGVLFNSTYSTNFAEIYKNGFFTSIKETPEYVYGAEFYDTQNGFLFGSSLLKTIDGGKTWTTLKTLNASDTIVRLENSPGIRGLSFSNSNEGILILPEPQNFLSGRTYYTNDSGESWNKTNATLPQEGDIRSLKIFNDINHGWAILGNSLARLGTP